jgi:murein DD-endopeptidase MepM/ murein hydrolase activator NlpD
MSPDQQEHTSPDSSPEQPELPLPTADNLTHQTTPHGRRRKAELALKILTYTTLVVLVVLVVLIARDRLLKRQTASVLSSAKQAAAAFVTPTPDPEQGTYVEVELPALAQDLPVVHQGIPRTSDLHTTIPARPRVDVITYTVEPGDTLFSIADTFGLKPETLLWGNFETLEDNPHLLRPEQVLNILPVNGTYYQWAEGDNLQNVADFFSVDPQVILAYPGNRFDLTEVSLASASIEPGTWIIVPDGKRAIKDWGPPAISRTNPAAARYYGPGYCGTIYEGAIGTSTFVWPAAAHSISGYSYNPGVHPAIDIAGGEGAPVSATDSGVVVYAGWSNYGYGNLIVIDHGNGWQSAYAHLSSYAVTCGQSVFQGGLIGAVGNTGNSYGSHLHFELVYGGAKLNPLDFLP